MKICLVTGVAGFIGSAVAKRLLEMGYRVIGIDNLSTGILEQVPENVEFYKMATHEGQMIELLNSYKFNAIFHIAGQSGGEPSYSNPVYDLQANTQSTLLLLKYAVDSGCKKFIYASTVSVYGEPRHNLEISEDALTLPKSFYGVGKLASENYLRIYSNQFGLDTVALRLFNIYGPGQNLDNLYQGMTSIFLSQAIRNKHIHVRGPKDRFRDLVYIDDTVDAFVKMMDSRIKGFNIYNVATSKKTSVEEIVNEIRINLPFDITVKYEGTTPGDVFGYTGSNKKIMNDINWIPLTSVKQGIKTMTKWALNLNKESKSYSKIEND